MSFAITIFSNILTITHFGKLYDCFEWDFISIVTKSRGDA